MDVHPPHEPVHSWRDALTHLGIVTIGLFIAVIREAVVENVHHRELVHEARENLRVELEQNHEALQRDLGSVDKESDLLTKALATLRYMKAHPHAQGQTISYQWNLSELHDAAWRTARDTGALGYMPYTNVREYTDLYELQANVTEQISRIMLREAELLAPILAQGEDFGKLPEAQFDDMLRDAATMGLDLVTLKQLMQILDQGYVRALKDQ